jgi:hypothetical protein
MTGAGVTGVRVTGAGVTGAGVTVAKMTGELQGGDCCRGDYTYTISGANMTTKRISGKAQIFEYSQHFRK